MGLHVLLLRGIEHVLDEGTSGFFAYCESNGCSGAAQGALDALRHMPGVIVGLDEMTWDEEAPTAARALLPTVMTYLFKRDDLIPAHDGEVVLGLLDDAYVALRAANEAAGQSDLLDREVIERHLASLRAVLPEGIVSDLDALVDEAVTAVTAQADLLTA